ncbi:MAG: carbohydrate ABC transporter substrate-binding protein [Acidimicrobiales bacterium]|nr:carbohydrate ABC transporter substrate-binding protein [Acidimicrobiales bacterium]
MKARTSSRAGLLAVAVLVFALLGAGCADDDDGDDTSTGGNGGDTSGQSVTMFGPEVEGEAQGLVDAFAAFEEDTGITIDYTGDRSFEQLIGTRVDGGDPPDIAFFPQPGKIRDFAPDAVALPESVVSIMEDNFDQGMIDLATVDGEVYGVPVKADLKSLVWYSPDDFEENGYEVPETMEDLLALADTMIAAGQTPFCVGIGSDAATGWPFTDWVEDFMLRLKGPEVYDQWVNHEIPFNDPQVVEVVQYVYDLWAKEGMVRGNVQNVADIPFADAGLPLLEDECMMHRQGNFYAANWPDGTEIGAEGEVNAFYLPTFADQDFGQVTLTGGIYAVAFSDDPEVIQALEFLAGTQFADDRAPTGGFLSPNKNTDVSKYPTEIEQTFAEILAEADPARFDASDLMPGEVGAGTFWTAAVDITSGNKSVQEALDDVEASWPE